ncbi:hypothetical protein [Halorubrum persicum]|uniref:hypothetical protein n=1 Tax=Halorubrum persicum TaxID=1383844 RepID=UPI0015D4C904|nr:hypothetical protein [Halorubrum persicum]
MIGHTVILRSAGGIVEQNVEAGVLATDAAIVDMARREAGISGGDFVSGEVVAK